VLGTQPAERLSNSLSPWSLKVKQSRNLPT
jgi:hypothetical protein